MHWPASRPDALAQLVRFVSLDLLEGKVQKEEVATGDIVDIAGEIADWWLDLNQFMLHLIFEVISSVTVHGPRPDPKPLSPETFRSLR